MELGAAMAAQWSKDYLVLGEVLAAYELASREKVVPILIVDEADKLPAKIEDMLLQVFARGYASIPRFGDVGVKDDPERWPIVVLLSNDIRHDLSAPTRSRCIYSWLDLPTAAESVAILSSRVPEAPADSVATVARILDCVIDIQGVVDKPALREGISLLSALVRDGVHAIDEEVMSKYLCHLAKRHNDRDYLRLSLGRLVYAANTSNPELDVLVQDYFAVRARSQMRVAA
jgi:MoxR-like ATPase